jgi:outer membrane protein TolC
MIMHAGPDYNLGTAVPHYYDVALELAATSSEQKLPWTSATGAIVYLRDSNEDLHAAQAAVHFTQAEVESVQSEHFLHQAEILTTSPAERREARMELVAAEQRKAQAQSHLSEVVGLRALAAQEQVVFFGKLGSVALRSVGFSNL